MAKEANKVIEFKYNSCFCSISRTESNISIRLSEFKYNSCFCSIDNRTSGKRSGK